MSVLNMDTEILRSSARVAEQTNAAISDAAGLLNAIAVHEDWKCRERNKIIEMTLQNRKTANEIQERSTAFYSAIRTAAGRFEETEQENCRRINTIDDVIGKVSTVVPQITETVFGGDATGGDIHIVDIFGLGNAMEE